MTTYNLVNEDIRKNCLKEIESTALGHQIIIKEYKKDKTRAQRNYFHKILQIISEYTGEYEEDLKMSIKYRVLPLREINVEGARHMFPISSEKTTIKQYADLIEAAQMMAVVVGVSIPSPKYYGYE